MVKMNKRDIHTYDEIDEAIDLVIHTKCPEKWLLIDRETGQAYVGNANGSWHRLEPVIKDVK
jgi:hypothetical protein